ncbi:unnamed protein product [Phyllotreta striolata]|uniref:Ig-like domain-containing protein n=1 Tax=Phyllotreta striolata TaxID=444603 RepID=A0A9N9TV16_PHYSR|nr:unnamed protein product [Phyllotreta striolata]
MSTDGNLLLLGFFAIFALFRDGTCLELRIEVPEAVLKGREVVLKCLFDLEGDKLYSVKWYHDSSEFYRFTPNGKHSSTPFQLKGFHVVQDRSNSNQVVLKHATKALTGQYSCEVTEDQPSFYTEMKTAYLEVVDPPQSDPIIVGTKSKYKLGDYVKATCSSEKSAPAVNLTWHVNGRPADESLVKHHRKTVEGKYINSYATLQFGMTEQQYNEGAIKLRCTASIHDVWQRTVEKVVEIKKPNFDSYNTSPAWMRPPSTSTERPRVSNEHYWLYVSKNSLESDDQTGNSTNSASIECVGKAIFLISIAVYVS